MTLALRTLLFLVLLGNCLTLIGRIYPFHVYTIDLALIPFLVLAGTRSLLSQSREFRWRTVDLVLMVLFSLVILSFAFSVDHLQSLQKTMDWLRMLLFYFACRSLPGRVLGARQLKWMFAGIAAVLLAIGAAQLITGTPIGLVSNLFGRNLDQLGSSTIVGFGARARVSGPTPNSNVYSMWIVLFVGLGLSFTIARQRALLFSTAMLMCLAVLSGTLSRAGTFGFVFFAGVLLWLERTRARSIRFAGPVAVSVLLGIGAATALTIGGVSAGVIEQFSVLSARAATSASTQGVRSELIRAGFRLLGDPRIALVGCGSDNFLEAAVRHGDPITFIADEATEEGNERRSGVHNVWVQTSVEHGIAASALLAALIASLGLRSWRLRAHAPADLEPIASYGVAIAIWYAAVTSQFYLMAARLPILSVVLLLLAFIVNHERFARRDAILPGVGPLPGPESRGC